MRRLVDVLREGQRQPGGRGVGAGAGRVYNPPGRRALAYRVADQDSLLGDMLQELRRWSVPAGEHRGTRPLAGLNLTDRRNWVVSLLRSWAAVGDVLTFYQERIANEGFLGTAVEDLSIRELVRLLDYRPGPGVAGSVHLAFTAVDAPELPDRVAVPSGTRVLSLPLDEQQPQTFETSRELIAFPELNSLRPVVPTIARGRALEGSATGMRLRGAPPGLAPGSGLVILAAGAAVPPWDDRSFRVARTVEVEAGARPGEAACAVTWERPLDRALPEPAVHLLRREAGLFGRDAVPWETLPEEEKRRYRPAPGGVQASADGGRTFGAAGRGLPDGTVSALAVEAEGALVAAVAGAGVFRSTDGGRSWDAAGQGLLGPDVLAFAAGGPGTLFAGTPAGVFRSTDGARRWQAVAVTTARRGLWDRIRGVQVLASLGQVPVRSLAVAAGRRGSYLFAGSETGIFRCRQPASPWHTVNRGLPGRSRETGLAEVVVHALAAGPGRRQLFAATSRGVLRSDNLGRRWRPASFGLPGREMRSGLTREAVTALLAFSDERSRRSVLLAGTARGVFRSTDGGRRWRPASAGFPGTDARSGLGCVAVDALARSTDSASLESPVFAATAAGLFRSIDHGESWEPVAAVRLEGAVEALAAGSGGRVAAAAPTADPGGDEWPGFRIEGRTLYLDALVPGIVPGGWLVLRQGVEGGEPRVGVYRVERTETVRRSAFGLTATATRVDTDTDRNLAGFDLRETVVHAVSEPVEPAAEQIPVSAPLSPMMVRLRRPYPERLPGPRPVIVTGKRLRARLTGGAPGPGSAPRGSFQVRTYAAHGDAGLRLELWHPSGLELSGVGEEAVAWEPAEEGDETVSEVAFAEEVEMPPAMRRAAAQGLAAETAPGLVIGGPLAHLYDPQTVTVQANVVRATQGGEAPEEVLGSGDATQANQRFTLKKPPLTYVRDPVTGRAHATLEVRVDGVRWDEVPSLHDAGPQDHVYMLRCDRRGDPMVVFGDGVRGARLPTGIENVRARYRSGLWTQPVAAGHLTLLQSRPVGLRGVTNPIAASPAAPPERAVTIRRRAPLIVRTLGRIVSLRDFEDFALTYPGVAKAQAVLLWIGHRPVVHLTIASSGGGELPPDDELRPGLARAIRAAGGTADQDLRIDPFERVAFGVEASLEVDDRFLSGEVAAAAGAALTEAFGFDASAFGRPVAPSDVLTVLQAVLGVAAVDLDALHRVGGPRRLDELTARPAALDPASGRIAPAQLLILDAPSGIRIAS